MAVDDLERALQDVLAGYPEPVVRRERERAQWGRYLHELRMMHSPRGRIVDLGGGVAATSAALARLGCEAYVVDSFNRPYYSSAEFARE